MLLQFFLTSLRILVFRAAPQDLPFAPRLSLPLGLLVALANTLMLAQVLPTGPSLFTGIAMASGMALITRLILRARKLEARFHQTFAAFAATTAILTFALVPLFAQLAPAMREIATDPTLLEHPDKLQLPSGVVFLMNLINLWNFAVTASILRHAANVTTGIGMMLALLAALSLFLFVAMVSALLSPLLVALGG